MSDLISELQHLPHFRSFECPACSATLRVHALQIYSHCPECGEKRKNRAFGGVGTEIQDFVDAVLVWAGEGESFDAVMTRRRELLADDKE